jgi:hypothetical protein
MSDKPDNISPTESVDEDDEGAIRHAITTIAESSRKRRVETLTVLLMALATVGTAWVSYEASRWGTVQTANFNASNAARVESSRASTTGGQLIQIDVALFVEAIDAFATDQTELVDFYSQRARPEFKPALDAWLALDPANNPDAPQSPFDMPEYQSALADEAALLVVDAEAATVAAATANQRGDNYILAAVIFASILFFAGISSTFKNPRYHYVVLSIATVGFVTNSIWVANFPVVLRV